MKTFVILETRTTFFNSCVLFRFAPGLQLYVLSSVFQCFFDSFREFSSGSFVKSKCRDASNDGESSVKGQGQRHPILVQAFDTQSKDPSYASERAEDTNC